MVVSASAQMLVFLSCALVGLACGALYDLFRAIRILFSPVRRAIFLFDLVFWLICALTLFAVLYITCGGGPRWFEFAGLALGMLLYFIAFSHLLLQGIVGMVKFIAGMLHTTAKATLLPFIRLIRLFVSFVHNNIKYIQKFNKIFSCFIKKTLEKINIIGIILKKALFRYVIRLRSRST